MYSSPQDDHPCSNQPTFLAETMHLTVATQN